MANSPSISFFFLFFNYYNLKLLVNINNYDDFGSRLFVHRLGVQFLSQILRSRNEEGSEPKCDYMLTCFIYHFYAGVRAGGGIGDELESPYGDDLELPRMLYDISFFFFVIVILLAIMQGTFKLFEILFFLGLIIDAFGELRNQQESATEKLETSCFICDIGNRSGIIFKRI